MVLDPRKLKRKPGEKEEITTESVSVSAGAVDKVIDLAFNPSRDKIREVTIIDRMQGRLLPQLDVVSVMWQYVIEVASYRQDANEYKKVYQKTVPEVPDLVDEFMFRTAQWQKSVAGKNLERATDIALAETEARAMEDEERKADDPWKD